MSEIFELSVLAADKPFFEGECEAVVIPAQGGQYGILAHHCNIIGAIVPGTLKITAMQNGEKKEIIAAVSAGLVKVENNRVLVLVDSAERPEEIDENRAKKQLEIAKEQLLHKKSKREYFEAQTRMARALNRLKVKRQFTKD